MPCRHELSRVVEMPSDSISAREANNPQQWSFASAGQGLINAVLAMESLQYI